MVAEIGGEEVDEVDGGGGPYPGGCSAADAAAPWRRAAAAMVPAERSKKRMMMEPIGWVKCAEMVQMDSLVCERCRLRDD